MDLLWRDTHVTGANVVWFMNNTNSLGSTYLQAQTVLNWKIVATGDVSGDGHSDIVWRHATSGQNAVWYMNGMGCTVQGCAWYVSSDSIQAVADTNWEIAGSGFFNLDSNLDLLWRSRVDGANVVWFMQGVAKLGDTYLGGQSNLNWTIAGTGDFGAAKVATPTISPSGGTFPESVTITLSTSTSGATIRYTTDGSEPTSGSTQYYVSFALTQSATMKAKAFKSGMTDSDTSASAGFTIKVAAPTISPNGGTFTGSTNVTLNTATSGATNRYTIDGSDPTSASTAYTAPFAMTASGVVKAKAFKSGMADSDITTSAAFTSKVFAPTISPNGGTFTGSTNVTLNTATSGATNRYTIDGSDPTLASTAYTVPFAMAQSGTVKAKAFKTGMADSDITSAWFTIKVIAPTISPNGGTFTGSTNVTLNTATSGATNRYTIDGSDPTSASTAYTVPFTVTQSGTVKAKAFMSGMADSDITSAGFTIKVIAPTISPNGGTFTGSTNVTLNTATSGATNRYTIDGSDPTSASTPYTVPFTVTQSGTVKAKAFKSGMADSDTTTSAAFTIKYPVPTFAPAPGTYNSGQPVTITSASAQLKVFQPNPNGLDPSVWQVGVWGSQGAFQCNGQITENTVEIRQTPYGTSDKVWVAHNDAASDADGGWNTTDFGVDRSKLYRFSVWMRRVDSTPAETLDVSYSYLGCGGGTVSTLTGTAIDSVSYNPYFWVGLLPANEWHLVVGYVHPAGDLTTTCSASAYNSQGQAVSASYGAWDFRWLTNTTASLHRAYLYYCAEVGVQQEFWNPRVEIVNSVTDPIDVLLVAPESSPKTITLAGTGARTIQALSYSSVTNMASSDVATATYTINSPPTISGISAQSVVTGLSTSAIAFTVGDAETNANYLTVTATSSNTNLVPSANMVLGGAGADRTITLTPIPGRTGTATIAVSVSDLMATTSTSFVLNVEAMQVAVPLGWDAGWVVNQYFNSNSPPHDPVGGVEFYFANGTNLTTPVTIPTNAASVIRFRGQSQAGTILRLNDNSFSNCVDKPGTSGLVLGSAYGAAPLPRVEIQDLTIDANWANQGVLAKPVHTLGFKILGININARTAAIRRVRVQNWGSNGTVPVYWFSPAGSEAFGILLSTRDVGQTAFPGDDAPLVVEDCEVSDVTTLHSGYYTAITIVTMPSDAYPRTNSIAVVQRCQIRGDGKGIGLGAAQASWVTFRNNAVLNCPTGMNFDTSPVKNIEIVGNVFLDTVAGVNIGGPGDSVAKFTYFGITNNAFRLYGRPTGQMYQDYWWWRDTPANRSRMESSQTLEMGRVRTNYAGVLFLSGGTASVSFNNNKVTTRPLDSFPPQTGEEKTFRVVRDDHPTAPWMSRDTNSDYYTPANNTPPTGSGNKLSKAAWDFTTNAWDFASMTDVPPTAETTNRTALANRTDGFKPAGTVGRVRVLSETPLSVCEVAIGTPTPAGSSTPSSVTVQVRVMNHPALTLPSYTQVNCQIISGPHQSTNQTVTLAQGFASFTFPTPSTPGVDRIVAWVDGDGGTTGAFDADKDYYSYIDYFYGNTVGVVTSDAPDVANDKTLKSGHFRFNRTGSMNQALNVNFSLPSGSLVYTNAAQPANATNTANADYTLWVKDAASTNEPTLLTNIAAGTGALNFGTNVVALDLEVRPEHDEDLEKEGVWLTITSVPTGAIQPSSGTACVAIYDGPKYSIIDLPIGPSEFAVCGLKNTGGDLTTMPDIVAYRRDNASLLSYTTNGYTRLSLDNPTGCSSGYGLGISDDGVMVGYASDSPDKAVCWAPATNYAPALLAALASGGAARAFAISPNGHYTVGYAMNSSSTPHAVRWDNPSGSWLAPLDLGALNGSATTPSYAYAANNAGRVVGASLGAMPFRNSAQKDGSKEGENRY